MEQMQRPLKSKNSDGIRQGFFGEPREMQGRNGIGFTGLVYDVEHKRFHFAHEDPMTGRIRIECRCDEVTQEPCMSISAA